ncbi:hypothetical protein E2C01_004616 [Portunus trituberculatus]|uniref:Uncharacterized protein n=1 Tax=Portunus trituberculatus TaxID=210409 RepID=A0A5B7CQZ8_PORTR|nr:hypothetical protein [Portunus trituberculatus]
MPVRRLKRSPGRPVGPSGALIKAVSWHIAPWSKSLRSNDYLERPQIWVGVHGGVGEDGAEPSSNAAASPSSPTTPHIIVSAEEDEVTDNATPKVRLTYENNEDQCDSSASNGQVVNNGVPATTINGGPHNEEKRPKLSLPMNSLDLPDPRRSSVDFNGYRRTRRNSMNEIMRRMGGSQVNLQLPTHHHMRRSSSKNSLEPSMVDWRQEGKLVDTL